MNMMGKSRSYIFGGLATVILAVAVTAQESVSNPDSQTQSDSHSDSEQEFKCLTCEKSNELMCYNNMTCGPGQTYCFYYLYKVETDEIATDLNQRAWGCTDSEESCIQGCEDSSCSRHKCCYGDVNFKNNKTLNATEYRSCIYGKSGDKGFQGGVWVVGLSSVLFVLYRRFLGL
ncbi:hypothetical protein ACHWQZ_G009541 [Mnemiopsis leidyi]